MELDKSHNFSLSQKARNTCYKDWKSVTRKMEKCSLRPDSTIALDVGVADYQIASRDNKFKKLEKPLASEVYAVGFLKGNDELRDTVQEDIYKLYDDGTVKELADKYGLTDYIVIEENRK